MSLFTKRKGRRISSFNDDDEPTTPNGSAPTGDSNNDDDNGPAVVRPSLLARSSSRRKKNRLSTASTTSRLSFGGGGLADDDGDNDNTPAVVTPKRNKATSSASLTQRVLETNAFRKSLSSRLPTRQRPDYDDGDVDIYDDSESKSKHRSDYGGGDDHDDGRPRYSQAYLDELQNSTPNTPANLSAMQKQDQHQNRRDLVDDADFMDLDPSELDGAMLVDSADLFTSTDDTKAVAAAPAAASPSAVSLRDRLGLGAVRPAPAPAAHVLTETEIQERKDRRARRAREQGSIALGASDDEQSGYISLLTDEQKRRRSEKESTRLVREDEDLGEGFDEFVEDRHAPLALGKKAERDARRRRKQEMADLINAAGAAAPHATLDDGSDDSEAERRAAYDAAQTRAGMDGLRQPGVHDDDDGDANVVHGGLHIPKMMSALPDLADCLAQMRSALHALDVGVAQHRQKLADVDREKAEIVARESEVQGILDAAAATYQTVLGGKPAGAASDTGDAAQGPDPGSAAASVPAFSTASPMRPLAPGQSPLRALPPGLAGAMPVERGLESLGTTPTRRPQANDYF